MSGGPTDPGGHDPFDKPSVQPILPPTQSLDIPTLVAEVEAASDAVDDAVEAFDAAWVKLKDALT